MKSYRYNVRAFARAVEAGADWQSTVQRSCELLRNYEVTGNEVEGYNSASCSNITTIEMLPVVDESQLDRSLRDATSAIIAVDVTIELESTDERSAAVEGREALSFLDLDPFFLAGYNSTHGTGFTSFTLDDLEEAVVEEIDADASAPAVRLTAPSEAEMERIRHLIPNEEA